MPVSRPTPTPSPALSRNDVILVAQSLAGFTAPLACARATVRMIVFVNAMIPKPGETAGAWWGWIVESALKNKQFVIDGEAVGLGVDGISDFNALHSGKHNDEVQLHAFDILALNGNDLRHLPLSMRKAHLSRLLARRPDGIFLSDFEQGEIGPDLFLAACRMGLEGLVSKAVRSTGSRLRTASIRRWFGAKCSGDRCHLAPVPPVKARAQGDSRSTGSR